MSLDIEKHVNYWVSSAKEDLDTAELLIGSQKLRHGLFFAHLALEKSFKAHLCRLTEQLPPRIHNLLRLYEKSNLELNDKQKDFIAKFDRYQLEGRYPEFWPAKIDKESADNEFKEAKELFQWLISQL